MHLTGAGVKLFKTTPRVAERVRFSSLHAAREQAALRRGWLLTVTRVFGCRLVETATQENNF